MTFTFVVDFRGGTYCSQVEATDLMPSLLAWITTISSQRKEIKHLGLKTIEALKILVTDSDHNPVELNGLRKIWYASYFTRKGVINMNIIQTDIS